jgi:hypothetical protein
MPEDSQVIAGRRNGGRSLLLHLLGRDARPLRNDLDIVVGHIWICLDGELMK